MRRLARIKFFQTRTGTFRITRIIKVYPAYPVHPCFAIYSNLTETSFETPGSSIVTPYSARAASIVRLL